MFQTVCCPTVISWGDMPTKEKARTDWVEDTRILKVPSAEEKVAFDVPFSTMLTPARASPALSVIFPEISRFWAKALLPHRRSSHKR